MGQVFSCGKKSMTQVEPEKELPKNPTHDIIDQIVDRYIRDELINQRYIPDGLEKRIYKASLRLVFGVVKDTLENSHVEVLGHRIGFTITPIDQPTPPPPHPASHACDDVTSQASGEDECAHHLPDI